MVDTNFLIADIESLKEFEAAELASEVLEVKGFTGYLINFKGYFGFSLVVFKNEHQIRYVNDYALHHKGCTIAELKDKYIFRMNNLLFTEKELLDKVVNYNDYSRKCYFVRNYWIMQFDYVSMFRMSNEPIPASYKYVVNDCFCYVEDETIALQARKYIEHLENGYNAILNDPELFREAISYELSNHEACITMSISDAMSALGLCKSNVQDWQIKIARAELDKQIHWYNEQGV